MTVSDIAGAQMGAVDPRTGLGALDALRASWRSALAGRNIRVALADGEDPRVIAASARLSDSGTVVPYLIGRQKVIQEVAARSGTRGCSHARRAVRPLYPGTDRGTAGGPALRGDRPTAHGIRRRLRRGGVSPNCGGAAGWTESDRDGAWHTDGVELFLDGASLGEISRLRRLCGHSRARRPTARRDRGRDGGELLLDHRRTAWRRHAA